MRIFPFLSKALHCVWDEHEKTFSFEALFGEMEDFPGMPLAGTKIGLGDAL